MLEHARKQERFHHEHLTTAAARTEIYGEINRENQRVNVDSAKKKACMQGMDYDNFRQMVLGANLMPTKPGAINIYKANEGMEFNHAAAITCIQQTNDVGNALGYDEAVVRECLALSNNDQLGAPRNQEEFQKFVVQKCHDSMQRYTYMRLIKESHYVGLFAREFDSELFLLLCKTFIEQVFENPAFNNEVE